MVNIRREMPDVQLTREQFKQRFRQRFCDPAFAPLQAEIDRLAEAAWNAYDDYRKAPRTERAGPGFADPDYELSLDWIEASRSIQQAEQRQKDPESPPRILLINGASRSEHTCPGESSKTWRLAMIARDVFTREPDFEIEVLDLSRLASEYGRIIYPCKACVSTAMPLCHWPCSCYPNHASSLRTPGCAIRARSDRDQPPLARRQACCSAPAIAYRGRHPKGSAPAEASCRRSSPR